MCMHVNSYERPLNKTSTTCTYWIKELGLYTSDCESIQHMHGWLTDAVINAAQTLLKRQHPDVGGLQNTNLGRNLTFAIERGTFVQMLHVHGNHWITISNMFCKSNEIDIFDSLNIGSISKEDQKQIAALIFTKENDITLNFPIVQMQRGSSDCGLFAVAFATSLCCGFNPAQVQYTQRIFRNHPSMTIFPLCRKKSCVTAAAKQETITIHCTCRQVSHGRMIQCGICEIWYHEKCVRVPRNVWKDISVKWNCPPCVLSANQA